MEPTPEDYKRTTGIYILVRIVEGPASAPGLGVGGRLRDYNTIKADAQFGLGQALGAFEMPELAKALSGRPIPSYQAFQAVTAALAARLKGKRAVAFIADTPGNEGRTFSSVERFHKASDWATYRNTQALGPSTAPAAPTPPRGGAPNGAAVAPGPDIFADLEQALP